MPSSAAVPPPVVVPDSAGGVRGTPERKGSGELVQPRSSERGTRGKRVDYQALMLGKDPLAKDLSLLSVGDKRGGGSGNDTLCSPSKRASVEKRREQVLSEGGIKRKGVAGLLVSVEERAAGWGGGKGVKMSKEERNRQKLKRQEEVIHSIGKGAVTEKFVLDRVGDSRYTREIVRRLLAQGMIERKGKGGSNDPFLYSVAVGTVNEQGLCVIPSNLVDPGLEVRLKRIEIKIVALLVAEREYTTEKVIRMVVGDNTGTGKAIRRLVNTGKVNRIGKGGVGDPYRYKLAHEVERGGEECGEDEEDLVADLTNDSNPYMNASTSPSQAPSPDENAQEPPAQECTKVFSPNWAKESKRAGAGRRLIGKHAPLGGGPQRYGRVAPRSARDEENEGRSSNAKLPSPGNLAAQMCDGGGGEMTCSPLVQGVAALGAFDMSSPVSMNGISPKFFGNVPAGWFGQEEAACRLSAAELGMALSASEGGNKAAASQDAGPREALGSRAAGGKNKEAPKGAPAEAASFLVGDA